MKEQLITPWDPKEALVPTYIVEMAQQVILHYDMKVKNMEVMAMKEELGGLIWKIETNKGPRSLKILHRRPTRSLFSLGVQEFLKKEKLARVPSIIPTKYGENYVEMGGKLWFVAEWIEPLTPVKIDLDGAKKLCYALGEFHRLSKGYIPPEEAEIASGVHRWPTRYQKMVEKMDWFRDIVKGYPQMPASSTILSVLDVYENQAQEALIRLERSKYYELAARGNEEWGIAHQDYGWGNAQKGKEGMWIIDLDGVAYDIPIRDLSKLIVDVSDKVGKWDYDWVKEMIQSYDKANPIDDDLYELLLNNLSLPTLFYKEVKDMVYEPTDFLSEELNSSVKRVIEIDKTKWPVLKKLSKNKMGGKS